jgi:hypothetical protein
MEYEFDVVADLDDTHTLSISKTRCSALDNAICVKPGADFFRTLKIWLEDGSDYAKGYYTANIADLQSTKDMTADKSAEQQEAQAAAARRAELKSMAGGQTQEQPPFEPDNKAATTAAPAATPTATAVENGKVTVEQLQELASLGQLIGRDVNQINTECKQHFGCSATELPREKAAKLIDAFRKTVDAAKGAGAGADSAKNQTAA